MLAVSPRDRLMARLLSHVVMPGFGPDDCWLWTGLMTSESPPYGRVSVTRPDEQEFLARRGVRFAGRHKVGTHQVMFVLTHGFLPPVVGHACDVTLCLRPIHLKASDRLKNMEDMARKGRQGKAAPK